MGGAHFSGGNITPAADSISSPTPRGGNRAQERGADHHAAARRDPQDPHQPRAHRQAAQPRQPGRQDRRRYPRRLRPVRHQVLRPEGRPGARRHGGRLPAQALAVQGKRINVQVDSREGITFGQTVADWYGGLKQPANVEWINEGDAQGSSTCSPSVSPACPESLAVRPAPGQPWRRLASWRRACSASPTTSVAGTASIRLSGRPNSSRVMPSRSRVGSSPISSGACRRIRSA